MKIVRCVGPRNLLSPAYQSLLSAVDTVVVDTLPPRPNVTVRFKRDGKPLQLNLREGVRDFLDLATTIYIADELIDREGGEDRWTRVFDFTFPMRQPELWQEATPLLSDTLQTLSGDYFQFMWMQRPSLPPLGRHRRRLPRNFDTVCLFSGGLDSLLGAYTLLRQGKKLLLVGHQAEGITASTQTAIAARLQTLFPGRVSLIQCRVSRSLVVRPRYHLPAKSENSHRPRSFLFLSIAVAIASAAGVEEIVIPENGLIAINAPLQSSRIGTLSTRTAHPKFLLQFQELVRQLGVYSGRIWNPFLYLSKTDMLSSMDDVVSDMASQTVSCAHAGDLRWTGSGLRHCGYCIPCIYRRIAMMGAGLDRTDDYIEDAFTSLPNLSKLKQSDLRALVSFARRVVVSTEAERQMLVLSHGAFSPEEAGRLGPEPAMDLTPWSSMLVRWALDFLDKVDAHSSAETKRILKA